MRVDLEESNANWVFEDRLWTERPRSLLTHCADSDIERGSVNETDGGPRREPMQTETQSVLRLKERAKGLELTESAEYTLTG